MVLDAAHLYSYAMVGQHLDSGGLMHRQDIHRLFDRGLLAVNPETLNVNVSNELEGYPMYADLQEVPLRVQLGDNQVEWIRSHWEQHRNFYRSP